MKQKKETLVSKASALLAKEPNLSPKEMAEKLGVKVQRVYVLRNTLKKKSAKKTVTNVQNKRKGRPPKEESLNARYIKSLQTQVHELEKWCYEWREKYKKLEQDYTQAKVMFLNSQAVVDYLENKVANLITINNLKGN